MSPGGKDLASKLGAILKALKAAEQSKRASEEEEKEAKEAAAGPPVTRVRIKDKGKMYVEMGASCMCSVCGLGGGEHAAAERPKQLARSLRFSLSLSSVRSLLSLCLYRSAPLLPLSLPLFASMCMYLATPQVNPAFFPSHASVATRHNRVYTTPRYTTYGALADALGKAAGMEKVRCC